MESLKQEETKEEWKKTKILSWILKRINKKDSA